jgi:hypothetical protein
MLIGPGISKTSSCTIPSRSFSIPFHCSADEQAELLIEFSLRSCHDLMSLCVPVRNHHDCSKDWVISFCTRLSCQRYISESLFVMIVKTRVMLEK